MPRAAAPGSTRAKLRAIAATGLPFPGVSVLAARLRLTPAAVKRAMGTDGVLADWRRSALVPPAPPEPIPADIAERMKIEAATPEERAEMFGQTRQRRRQTDS